MELETLYQQANQCLEQGRFAEARELGHRLLKWRFTGAFEVLGKAFRGEGQLPVAIQVLESGVREAPEVWLLWLQLGNYRSEAGDLAGAVQAYATARGCPGAETDQIDFNEAFLRRRAGNAERALELFQKVYRKTKDRRLRVVALTHRLTTLVELDRLTEALIELGEAYLHEADNAELLAKLAFCCLERDDRPNALNLAKQALGLKRAGEVARVVRLLEGERSDHSRLFEVVLRGRLEEPEGTYQFTKTSRVYAADREEAVRLALEFEPADVRDELQVQKVEESACDPTEPKGVDWSSGLEFIERPSGETG